LSITINRAQHIVSSGATLTGKVRAEIGDKLLYYLDERERFAKEYKRTSGIVEKIDKILELDAKLKVK